MERTVNQVKSNIKQLTNTSDYKLWKSRVIGDIKLTGCHVVLTKNPPIKKEKLRKWDILEAKAHWHLFNNLSDNLYSIYVKPEQKAKELLVVLDENFEKQCTEVSMNLQDRLVTMKYKPPLKTMLEEYDKLLTDIHAAGDDLPENTKVHNLFRKMPPAYNSTIEVLKGTPNLILQLAKSKLLAREADIENMQRDEPKALFTNSTYNNQRGFGGGRGNFTRGRGNFQRGFNRGRGFGYSGRGRGEYPNKDDRNNKRFKRCFKCNSTEHTINNCQKRQTKPEHVHANLAVRQSEDNNSYAFMTSSYQIGNKERCILDTGATEHMINVEQWADVFEELCPPIPIKMASAGSETLATHRGAMEIETDNNETFKLENVLFVPNLTQNLLSATSLMAKGCKIILEEKKSTIATPGGHKLHWEYKSNLFGLICV